MRSVMQLNRPDGSLPRDGQELVPGTVPETVPTEAGSDRSGLVMEKCRCGEHKDSRLSWCEMSCLEGRSLKRLIAYACVGAHRSGRIPLMSDQNFTKNGFFPHTCRAHLPHHPLLPIKTSPSSRIDAARGLNSVQLRHSESAWPVPLTSNNCSFARSSPEEPLKSCLQGWTETETETAET